jgi:hypothetical protein
MSPSPLATEPVTGNSLTQYLRSMTNLFGTQGEQTFSSGQQQYQAGLQDFGPSMQYWQNILSGNKAEMESAIAPEKEGILERYRAARKKISQTGARGGGTNEAVAQSEFSQAGDTAKLLQQLRPQAAQQSAQIASQVANLGLNESNLGLTSLTAALQGILSERGQDINQQTSNLQMLSAGLGQVFSQVYHVAMGK